MNYASVVCVGFGVIATVWYFVHAKHGMFQAPGYPSSCEHMLIRPNSVQGPSSFRWIVENIDAWNGDLRIFRSASRTCLLYVKSGEWLANEFWLG